MAEPKRPDELTISELSKIYTGRTPRKRKFFKDFGRQAKNTRF